MSAKGLTTLLRGRFKDINWTGTGYVNPRIRAGDAVLFNLKCKHSGYFVRLRGPFEDVALPVAIDNMLKRIAFSSTVGRKLVYLIARPFPDYVRPFISTSAPIRIGRAASSTTASQHRTPRKATGKCSDCARPEFVERMKRSGIPVLNNPIFWI